MAFFLILAPWIFNWFGITPAKWVFVGVGTLLLFSSLGTNYYRSLKRKIPIGIHMAIDTLSGLYLLSAPYLYSYRELLSKVQYNIHLIFGLLLLVLVALTHPKIEAAKSPSERAEINHDPLPR